MATVITQPSTSVVMQAGVIAGALRGDVSHQKTTQFPVGTGSGKADKMLPVQFTVSAGTPYVLDLTALPDLGGGPAVTLVRLGAILIENLSVTAGENFTHGGGSNAAYAADPKTIRPGGAAFWQDAADGLTVDSTHRYVQISAAAGTNVAGVITVLGATA